MTTLRSCGDYMQKMHEHGCLYNETDDADPCSARRASREKALKYFAEHVDKVQALTDDTIQLNGRRSVFGESSVHRVGFSFAEANLARHSAILGTKDGPTLVTSVHHPMLADFNFPATWINQRARDCLVTMF